MNIVKIEWLDAHGGAGNWKDLAAEYYPVKVFTVGFLQEFDGGVVVTPSYSPDQPDSAAQGFGEVHIPRGCIVSITDLGRNSED